MGLVFFIVGKPRHILRFVAGNVYPKFSVDSFGTVYLSTTKLAGFITV